MAIGWLRMELHVQKNGWLMARDSAWLMVGLMIKTATLKGCLVVTKWLTRDQHPVAL